MREIGDVEKWHLAVLGIERVAQPVADEEEAEEDDDEEAEREARAARACHIASSARPR